MSEWERIALGDVLTLHYGKALDGAVRDTNGSVPVYGANGIKDYAEVSLTSGPVLVVGRKGSAGEVTRVEGPLWPLDVTYYTEHDAARIDFDFLEHLLRLLDLPSLAKGVKPGINRNDVYELPILLPQLDEQRRIVAKLDQAFAALGDARANAEANLVDAEELFASELDEVFTRKGGDWTRRKLASLGTIMTGSTPRTSESGNFGDEVPFITPGDFRADGSLDTDNRGLSKEGATKVRLIPAGSALMVCIGATIGKAGFTMTEIAANQQINAICPNDDVSGEFLYYQFLTPRFQKSLMKRAGQATLPIVSKGKWSELEVRMPPRLSLQAELVMKMREMRLQTAGLQSNYSAKLANIATLRKSLLQAAFSGQLT